MYQAGRRACRCSPLSSVECCSVQLCPCRIRGMFPQPALQISWANVLLLHGLEHVICRTPGIRGASSRLRVQFSVIRRSKQFRRLKGEQVCWCFGGIVMYVSLVLLHESVVLVCSCVARSACRGSVRSRRSAAGQPVPPRLGSWRIGKIAGWHKSAAVVGQAIFFWVSILVINLVAERDHDLTNQRFIRMSVTAPTCSWSKPSRGAKS